MKVVHTFTVGQMRVNCYVLVDTVSREAIIIDPGDEAGYLAEKIESLQAKPIAILATHGHFDHVLAASELQLMYRVPFVMCKLDQFLLDRMTQTAEHFLGHAIVEFPPKISQSLQDKEVIRFGKISLFVVSTPGHTPGSVSFYEKESGCLFVGDTIFSGGGVGRTDFFYSDKSKLSSSVQHILTFPSSMKLFSGHGEETTILKEKVFHV